MASNNIYEEKLEGSAETVSSHLTAADTDGPEAALFIIVEQSCFLGLHPPGASVLQERMFFSYLEASSHQASTVVTDLLVSKTRCNVKISPKAKVVTVKCYYSDGTNLR